MSKLDQICELISEIEFSDMRAREIRHLMSEYKRDRPTTFRDLAKIPGFRKLWEAIEEACSFSCREALYAEEEKEPRG